MASGENPKKPGGGLFKDRLAILVPALAVLVVGFVIAFRFVEPPPPDHIVIATGARDGAYHGFAQRYREILAEYDITLEVRETTGSIVNLALLDDPASGADLAFVQGGTGDAAASPQLVSLASLYYEPIWLFTRPSLFGPDRLRALAGKRVAVGPQGSGTRMLARMLLGEVGIAETTTLSPLGGGKAVAALRGGEIDAAFLVAGPSAPAVRSMFADPPMDLMSVRLADAFVLRHRFLSKLTLPRGAIDPARTQPPGDAVLLAPTAALVARGGLHPALMELMLRVAEQVHRAGGLFEAPGAFPAGTHLDFPLADEARRYLKSGPSFLQRYLPFWIANFIDRTKVMLVPLLTLLIPVFRILPPAYRWRMRSKIIRWYKDLALLESHLAAAGPGDDVSALVGEIERIEGEVRDMSIPSGYLDAVYSLRLHIDLVRSRLAERGATRPLPEA